MNTYKLTAAGRGYFVLNGELYSGVNLKYRKRITYKMKCPKSYKEIGAFVCNERTIYESGVVTIYKTRRGHAASLYKDGCFKPFYATCELIEYKRPVKSELSHDF